MNWLRRRRLARRIARVHRDLDALDAALNVAGLSRQSRRRVWREVIAGRLTPSELIGKETTC